jgi:phosphoglucosamine mutase
MRADAGVVISASHNPYQDNGIKIFGPDGFKLPDAEEAEIEALMERPSSTFKAASPTSTSARGPHRRRARALRRLRKNTFPNAPLRSTALRVVIDARARRGVPRRARRVRGARRRGHALGVKPNGKNINDDAARCTPSTWRPRGRQAQGAHVGIALDGDADRSSWSTSAATSSTATRSWRCARARMLAGKLPREGHRRRDGDVQPRPRARARAIGRQLVRTAVGDRYVVEAMREGRLQLRRRAVGPPPLPRPRDDGRRARRGAAGRSRSCWKTGAPLRARARR